MPTKIEWTEETWNPFVGCSKVSEGCRNCYALRGAARMQGFGFAAYAGTTKNNGSLNWTGRINRGSDATWQKPLKITKPTMIFVNSMSDFWHPAAPDEWRREAIDIMWMCPEHKFQVLTKRPELIQPCLDRLDLQLPENCWIGTTVEDARVKSRIDALRDTQTDLRFLSIEPLIGAVGRLDLRGIHWVIAGGESGPGSRPMQADWVREIRDQCLDSRVPFFFKQWGTARNNPVQPPDDHGKGGSMLDGKFWKEWPE